MVIENDDTDHNLQAECARVLACKPSQVCPVGKKGVGVMVIQG